MSTHWRKKCSATNGKYKYDKGVILIVFYETNKERVTNILLHARMFVVYNVVTYGNGFK